MSDPVWSRALDRQAATSPGDAAPAARLLFYGVATW